MKNCSRCQTQNDNGATFCSNCGIQFLQPPRKPKFGDELTKQNLIIIGATVVFCLGLGLLAMIGNALNGKQSNKVDNLYIPPKETKTISEPSAPPAPREPTSKERLTEAKKLMADGYNEKNGGYGKIALAKPHLEVITSDTKEYKEAQSLLKEIARREVGIEKMSKKIARKMVIEEMERKMLSEGYDFTFSTSGAEDDVLTIKFVLMSRPIVYKLTNESDFLQNMKKVGLKKVIFTDGYGDSWSFDLTE